MIKRFMEWLRYKKLARELDKELRYYHNSTSAFGMFLERLNNMGLDGTAAIVQVRYEQDMQYSEALHTLKNKINSNLKTGSKEEYHQALSELDDLIGLSRTETTSKKALRKLLEKMYVAKGADVKTKKDKKSMINDRIGHYKELQNYKEGRELLKKARTARKEGNEEEAIDLEEQWRNNYGPKSPRYIR